ncbi:MAG: UPF0175 family protein [Candidatus Vecturithrix sp.]|jgi:predicted HTH domain antitoxin|nr:UPF0175 family protein [Candidatus Vecturithrix sp.]
MIQTRTIRTIIEFPEDLYLSLSAFGLTQEVLARESRKLLALKFFREKLLSFGKAAELSGLSKWGFIDYLGENGIPVIDYDDQELARELETVERLMGRLKA